MAFNAFNTRYLSGFVFNNRFLSLLLSYDLSAFKFVRKHLSAPLSTRWQIPLGSPLNSPRRCCHLAVVTIKHCGLPVLKQWLENWKLVSFQPASAQKHNRRRLSPLAPAQTFQENQLQTPTPRYTPIAFIYLQHLENIESLLNHRLVFGLKMSNKNCTETS